MIGHDATLHFSFPVCRACALSCACSNLLSTEVEAAHVKHVPPLMTFQPSEKYSRSQETQKHQTGVVCELVHQSSPATHINLLTQESPQAKLHVHVLYSAVPALKVWRVQMADWVSPVCHTPAYSSLKRAASDM